MLVALFLQPMHGPLDTGKPLVHVRSLANYHRAMLLIIIELLLHRQGHTTYACNLDWSEDMALIRNIERTQLRRWGSPSAVPQKSVLRWPWPSAAGSLCPMDKVSARPLGDGPFVPDT